MFIAVMIVFTSVFFTCAIILAAVYYRQNPEAQLRKRLNEMIEQAEAERAKNAKHKKNKSTVVIEKSTGAPRVSSRKKTFFERVIRPMFQTVDERTQKFAPEEIRAQLEEKIFRAGKTGVWNVRRLVTFWFLSIIGSTVLALLVVKDLSIHPVQQIAIVALGVICGATVPFAVLNSKIRQRQKELRKQLPEFLDILCVSVHAGLSFDGAVGKMIHRMKGPLIEEFKRAQNDVALGMTHQYALTQLAKRCDLEEIYLFTTSVIQAEKLGTSMTRTLKLQADNMRDRHRQYVKAEALKAPVKIIFPMVLFIFPSVFVLLLFPVMLQLMKTMGGG